MNKRKIIANGKRDEWYMDHIRLKLEESQAFVNKFHRHSEPLKRHMFSIGVLKVASHSQGKSIVLGLMKDMFNAHEAYEVSNPDYLWGIATVDRCSSSWSKYRDHVEIRRVCVREDAPKNVASYLIGQAKDACFAMGYNVVVTYTKPCESGASLRAVGFNMTSYRFSPDNPDRGLCRWTIRRDREGNVEWTKDALEEIERHRREVFWEKFVKAHPPLIGG